MDRNSLLFFVLSLLSFGFWLFIAFFPVNPDRIASGGMCESCIPGMLQLYASVALLLGVMFLALFLLSRFLKPDFSFLSPDTKKGLAILFTIIFLLYLSQAIFSMETVTDDSYSHYLNARYSWQHPMLFLDLFHKPVFNFLASFFAQGGFFHYRLFGIIVSVITLAVVYLTSKELKIENPWFALVAAAFAPVFFLNSAAGVNETLFGLWAIAAVYCMVRKNHVASAFFVSLLPFTRFEGLLIIPVWFFILVRKRDFRAIAALFAVPAAIWLGGALIKQNLLWVLTENPNYLLSTVYLAGKYGHYPLSALFEKFFFISGPATLLLFQLGLLKMAGKEWKKEGTALWPMLGIFLPYFLLHVYNNSFGSFGAMALEFKLSPIVPVIAIFAAIGMNHFFNAGREKAAKRDALLPALFIAEAIALLFLIDSGLEVVFTLLFLFTALFYLGAFLFNIYFRERTSDSLAGKAVFFSKILLIMLLFMPAIVYAHPPQKLNIEHEMASEVVEWLHRSGYSDRKVLATMGFVLVKHEKGFNAVCGAVQNEVMDCLYRPFRNFREAEKGTIVVWDSHYSWQFASREEIEAAGYSLLHALQYKNGNPSFYVFEKQ